MKKKLLKLLFAILITFSFQNCTVQKQLSVYDGSKSDGTITMSYDYNDFEVPVVDYEQGKKEAESRCKKWGYSGAEMFGANETVCTSYDDSGCDSWRVFYKYQCID